MVRARVFARIRCVLELDARLARLNWVLVASVPVHELNGGSILRGTQGLTRGKL